MTEQQASSEPLEQFSGFLPGIKIPDSIYQHLIVCPDHDDILTSELTPQQRSLNTERSSTPVPGEEGKDAKTEPDALSLAYATWNDQRRLTNTYNDPIVEDLYMVFTHRSEGTSLLVAAVCISGAAIQSIPFLWPDWTAVVSIVLATVMFLIAVLAAVNTLPKKAHYHEVLRATKGIERLIACWLFFGSSFALQYYGYAAHCWVDEVEHGLEYRHAAYTKCVNILDAYSILMQVVACAVINVRFKAVVLILPLYPVMLAIGRPFQLKVDSGSRFALLLVVHSVFTAMLIIILRVRSGRNRRAFEKWILLQRNIRGFQQENALVTTQLRGMLPADVTHKLFRGEVAFEVRRAATVSVCAIHDYVAWSYGLLPAVHFKTMDCLFCAFDSSIAVKNLVSKWKVIGDRYISGTVSSSPDELKTAVRSPAAELIRFAFFQVRTASRLTQLGGTQLKVCVAINTGPCCTGIIGTTSLWYEAVGEAVNTATIIARAADAGQVLLTRSALEADGADTACSTSHHIVIPSSTKGIDCFPASMKRISKLPRTSITSVMSDMNEMSASYDNMQLPLEPQEEEATVEEKERLDRERFAILQKRAGISDTRQGLQLHAINEQIDTDILRFSSVIPTPVMRFTDPEVEKEYGRYDPQNTGPEKTSLPFTIGFVGMMLLIATAENSLTVEAAIILVVDLFALAACAKIRENGIKPPEPVVATVWYSLPVLATAYLRESTLGARRMYLSFILPVLALEHLIGYPWLFSFALCAVIIIADIIMDHALSTVFPALGILSFFWAIFVFYQAFALERKRRLEFRDSLVSGAYREAVRGELQLQRAIQNMIVPPSLARHFSAKQRRETTGLIDSGDVCIARLRAEAFAEDVETPSAALASMEALYGLVERFIQDRDRIVEKIQTMGDEITLAGPLRYENTSLSIADASKPYGPSHMAPPQAANGKRARRKSFASDIDPVLAAALTLLDLVAHVQSTCSSLTAVCDSGSVFAAVFGELRPTFGVVGPAMRSLDAIFEAAPPNSRQVTSDFYQVLRNHHVSLPRTDSDFQLAPPQRWRLRGRGIATIFTLVSQCKDVPEVD